MASWEIPVAGPPCRFWWEKPSFNGWFSIKTCLPLALGNSRGRLGWTWRGNIYESWEPSNPRNLRSNDLRDGRSSVSPSFSISVRPSPYLYIYMRVCVLNINICLVVGFASGFLTSKYLAWKLTGMPKESLERSLSTANPKYWRNIEGTCSRISPYNTCT